MIIVSQDRKQVWNYDNLEEIFIPKTILNEENWCLKAQTLRGDVYILGYYKTETRAKEVLQEIKNTFSASSLNGTHDEIDLILKAKFMARYEMPEE